MIHASLFTGIGGFDLAAEWMGWENAFQCEIDPWCRKLLQQNFPLIQHRYEDIRTTDFSVWRNTVDVLSGGFPCQPYSTAGLRRGTEDERHLWPQKLRAIREIQPPWVVGENVRGLTNWNGGLVFNEVQADLETAGYEVTPFLLPAAGVNAPHERYRIFFIAYSTSFRFKRDIFNREGIQRQQQTCGEIGASCYKEGAFANTYSCGLERGESQKGKKIPVNGIAWGKFPTQSPICRGDDGVPNRVDRIKGLGNAVVPQVVLQIFKAIEQYESLTQNA